MGQTFSSGGDRMIGSAVMPYRSKSCAGFYFFQCATALLRLFQGDRRIGIAGYQRSWTIFIVPFASQFGPQIFALTTSGKLT